MTMYALMDELAEAKIRLRRDGGTLYVRGAKGGIPEDLIGKVRSHKPVLLEALSSAHLDETLQRSAAVVGLSPLTPVQINFFTRAGNNLHHFNQSFLVSIPRGLNLAHVEAFAERIHQRHDALRSSFSYTAGQWTLQYLPYSAAEARAVVRRLDLSAVDLGLEEAMARYNPALQESLSLTGPLSRIALIELKSGDKYLLVIVHHLVTDIVSWSILLDDLQHVIQGEGREESAGINSSPYFHHAAALMEYSKSEQLRDDKERYWLPQLQRPSAALPIQRRESNVVGGTHVVQIVCNEQTLGGALQVAGRRHRARSEEIVLAALLGAVSRWAGTADVALDIESHGRQIPFRCLDLSTTVGWFTSIYPLFATIEPSLDAVEILRRTKNALRAVPAGGIGFGALRYLAQDQQVCELDEGRSRRISFNYLGSSSNDAVRSSGIELVADGVSHTVSPTAERWYDIEFLAAERRDALVITLKCGSDPDIREGVTGLVSKIQAMLSDIVAADVVSGGVAILASDFEDCSMSDEELATILADGVLIEDIYRATPLQHGIYFQHCVAPTSYVEQHVLLVEETIDQVAFSRAWQQLVDRHEVLRAGFVECARDLHQIVMAGGPVVAEHLDWSSLSTDEIADARKRWIIEDRQRSYDLRRPPLFRLTLAVLPSGATTVLISFHHIIMDAWSYRAILNELWSLYRGALHGLQPRLQGRTSFGRYARWVRQRKDEDTLAFWRQKIVFESAPKFPFRKLREEDGRADHCRSEVEIPAAVSADLYAFARNTCVPVGAVVAAAWAYVLHRYTAEDDVLFGMTFTGRAAALEGIESVVGPTIVTVPVAFRFDEAVSITRVAVWLKQLHFALQEFEDHGHVSLSAIARLLQDGREGADFLDTNLTVSLRDDSTQQVIPRPEQEFIEGTHYAVAVNVIQSTSLRVKCTVDRSRVDAEGAERLMRAFAHVLCSMPTSESLPVRELPILTKDDSSFIEKCCAREVSVAWQATTIFELMDQHVSRQPHAVAVTDDTGHLTYLELSQLADAIGSSISARHGLLRQAAVAVLMDRSTDLIAVVLALWRSGLIYVPLDPRWPQDRCERVVNQAQCSVVIVQSHLLEQRLGWRWGATIASMEELKLHKEARPSQPAVATDIAYIIFTSGSTGQPKGAMIEHRGMFNHIMNKITDLGMNSDTRLAQNSPQSFDVSIWQMFAALLTGGTTHVIGEVLIQNPSGLLEKVAAEEITIIETVPSYLRLLVEVLSSSIGLIGRMSNLKHMLVNGEAVDAALIRAWLALVPSSVVINCYGPSEASDDVTHYPIDPARLQDPVPIGVPLANLGVYIVDKRLRIQPVMARGEIVVTGVGVGRGYIGDEQRTAAAFVEMSRGGVTVQAYKTGDLGLLTGNGLLQFEGRLDDQVKVHGNRIELGEVERALCSLAGIDQAVVLKCVDDSSTAFLCGFVSGPGLVAEEELRAQLQLKLPAYMQPQRLLHMNEWPLNANGKIDKRQLRRMGEGLGGRPARQARADTGNQVGPDELAIRERLLSIWQEVLGVRDIGLDEDYLALGGDSFRAIRIAYKYGKPLSAMDLFRSSTIRQLARTLLATQGAEAKLLTSLLVSGKTPRAVMLGVPHSAAHPVMFRQLVDILRAQADDITFLAVDFPRVQLQNNDALAKAKLLVTELACAISKERRVPLVLFGQCNGSAVTLALAHELESQGVPVRAVCLGGALPRLRFTRVDTRSDEEIISFLDTLGANLPTEQQERTFFLSDFRYDGAIARELYNDAYRCVRAGKYRRIRAPLYCFVGTADPVTHNYKILHKEWLSFFERVKLIEAEGVGHYLLRDCPDLLARVLASIAGGCEPATGFTDACGILDRIRLSWSHARDALMSRRAHVD